MDFSSPHCSKSSFRSADPATKRTFTCLPTSSERWATGTTPGGMRREETSSTTRHASVTVSPGESTQAVSRTGTLGLGVVPRAECRETSPHASALPSNTPVRYIIQRCQGFIYAPAARPSSIDVISAARPSWTDRSLGFRRPAVVAIKSAGLSGRPDHPSRTNALFLFPLLNIWLFFPIVATNQGSRKETSDGGTSRAMGEYVVFLCVGTDGMWPGLRGAARPLRRRRL